MKIETINFAYILLPCHEKTCFMLYANKKDADQPAHPRSLISAFVVRFLDSIIPIRTKPRISRFQLASVAEQAGLKLNWSKIPKTRFRVMWLL